MSDGDHLLPGTAVPWTQWNEINLCWDIDARKWSLHTTVPTGPAAALGPSQAVAIDEGIINPMALAAYGLDSTAEHPVLDVAVINGREDRAIKRERMTPAVDRKRRRN